AATTEYNTKKLLDGTIGSKAAEKADSEGINNDSKLAVDGIIRTTGEYKVTVLQAATKATAYIVGEAAVNTVPPDQAGGLYEFVGSVAGEFTFKIEQEGKVALATVTSVAGAGDSMTEAVRKLNIAMEEEGIKARAHYNEFGDLPFAAAGTNTLAMINIESTEYGSKHEIHIEVSAQPVGGGFSETLRNTTSGTAFALYNSDLTNSDGKLVNTLDFQGDVNTYWLNERSAATDGWRGGVIEVTTRGGTNTVVSVGADVAVTITNLTAVANVTATWDEANGSINITDSSSGSGDFKIENYDNVSLTNSDVGWANWLGIYQQTYGNEIRGSRISRTRDYVLQVEDPDQNTAILRGRLGDRSSFFAAQETTSAVLSSGVDPDSGGEIQAGAGGIGGISFNLHEIQTVENQSQFSILASAGNLSLQIGPNEGADHRMTITVDDMSVSGLGLPSQLDLSTQRAAMALMDSAQVDRAINRVSKQRAKLGALQNRLEHTVQNLGVTRENLQSSESRIRDADMAAEMMEFTKNQILMQTGTAMLAQANQVPQSVLQLLQ
ncbi:MAG: flagellin, partial [bacterium]|nr:flagellin [bacterium]